jgi:crotonobetaine/carnitine-CoA ligase
MSPPEPSHLHPFLGQDAAHWIDERAQQHGEHPMLIWAPFDAPSQTWSYARFAHDVACIAGGLARQGVKLGDRVLVHLENCPETVLMRFACARLGALCVATNAMAAGPELEWFCQWSGACVAITQPKFAMMLDQHCKGLDWIAVTQTDAGTDNPNASRPSHAIAFQSLVDQPLPAREVDPLLPASIMFTTGTTSRPKGVVWTHANMLWAGKLGAMQQGIRQEDICHIFLPLFHVVGLAWSFLPTLWAGATVLLQPRFSASRYWPSAIEHKATLGSQVLFTSRLLAQQDVPPHHFRQWTDAVCRPEFDIHFKLRTIGGWGMTEMVAQPIITDPTLPSIPHTIGRPSTAYDLRVVDDTGHALESTGKGQLLVRGVRGVSIFAEYFKDPKATSEAFDAEGYFLTGDIVKLHHHGALEFSERSKDVIKVGGEGVSAAEIEQVIGQVSGVLEAAVVARSDAHFGEVAIAFIRIKADASADCVQRIMTHCQATLAKFKVPREVIVLEDFPRVGFGKLSKARLREMARESSTPPTSITPLRNNA